MHAETRGFAPVRQAPADRTAHPARWRICVFKGRALARRARRALDDCEESPHAASAWILVIRQLIRDSRPPADARQGPAQPTQPSVTGRVLALEGQRQDLDVLNRDEAACAVELKCRDIAGFRLNRQPDGPGGGSRLADGVNERPRHPPASGTGYDVQIP